MRNDRQKLLETDRSLALLEWVREQVETLAERMETKNVQEKKQQDPEAYWNTDVPRDKTDRKEHGYSDKYTLMVPGDL